MVALFLSYYAGSTLFLHSHETETGTVTHSHPYVPTSSHSHSQASLNTIDALSIFMPILATAIILGVLFTNILISFYESVVLAQRSGCLRHLSVRPPPSYSKRVLNYLEIHSL